MKRFLKSFNMKAQLLVAINCLFAIAGFADELTTVFRRSFISGTPELQRQRDLQKGWIVDTLKRVDSGQSFDRFGRESEGLRFGLFILEPDEATPSAMYAIAVFRNDSSQGKAINRNVVIMHVVKPRHLPAVPARFRFLPVFCPRNRDTPEYI